MKTDIQIASETKLLNIYEVAKKLNLSEDNIIPFGKYKAKLENVSASSKKGKLILVTAINPTPYGEGKTTVSIGLADGLNHIGKKACLALREPSLGPVFGLKGGATGGGYAQVVPMDDINLHFNGDFHAITSANNLLASLIDNHIKQGNELKIDLNRIEWKRCLDVNDRALREITVAQGGEVNGIPRQDGFNITAASEIMAILCLSKDLSDLKRRLSNIIIGYDQDGKELCAKDLKGQDAMAILLKEAIKPNLVQTLEGTPCIMHGGPFANIAHGCNSVNATNTALNLADYVITEAGFGAELGAEKFFDIKCRYADLSPKAVVLVATCRSLKYNGGVEKSFINTENLEALTKGLVNLGGHIENLTKVFNMKVIVAINRFYSDTDAEIATIQEYSKQFGINAIITNGYSEGGKGCIELAEKVALLADQSTNKLTYSYELDCDIQDKVFAVANKVYGADKIVFSEHAIQKINLLNKTKYRNLPICIAKTQYSFSQDEKVLGRPKGFTFEVRDISLRAGSEFIVIIAGKIMLMPGLPKVPASDNMTIDDNGIIDGLF